MHRIILTGLMVLALGTNFSYAQMGGGLGERGGMGMGGGGMSDSGMMESKGMSSGMMHGISSVRLRFK
jgi:hypothetical protein